MDPRKILRIARWEVTKNADGIDRRTIAIVVATLLLIGGLTPLVAAQGIALDEGIYRVDIDQNSPINRVVDADATFTRVDSRANADILVRGTQAVAAERGSDKAQAALAELRESIVAYNDAIATQDNNQTAAYPVTVTLRYVERDVQITLAGSGGDDDDDDGNGAGTGGGGTGGGDGQTSDDSGDGDSTVGGGGGGLDGIARDLFGSSSSTGTPSEISPPFPFQSLVLAFIFVLPLNFVIQAYGSTILSERLNRRGELMLVSPITRGDIIAGKTLPYFLGAMGFEVLITAGIIFLRDGGSGGLYSLVAVFPLVLLFLSATFLGAMFARSFKELTFVTVAITVTLTSYAFVPAIFTDVTPIALVSPLTIVVRDLAGQAISLTALGFSILPPLLTSILFFGLGAGLYREEDMFTQRPIPLKVLDALAGRIKRKRSVGFVVAILMPFVIVAELLAAAAVFPISIASVVPESVSLVLILGAIVVIEEVAKGLPSYAGFVHHRYDRSLRTTVIVGAFAGVGFFIAEKGLLLIQLLPQDLPQVQRAAVASSGPVGEITPLIAVVLLFLPLALHVVTAVISALGARKGRRAFAAGLAIAMVIHFAYNFAVVTLYV